MNDRAKADARPAPLDRATIVRTALRLLDRDGIDGLSTRRLAAELGIKSASLYWHFRDKDELLAEMSSAMFDECVTRADIESPGFDPLQYLAEGARRVRRVALSRRDGASVMAPSRPRTPHDRAAFDASVKAVMQSGLTDMEARLAVLAVRRFAIGAAMQEQAAPGSPRTAGAAIDGEASFEFGLEAILEGLRARLADRATSQAAPRKSRA